MGKGKGKKKVKTTAPVSKRGIALAMDCTWSVEGRTLKNKDQKVKEPKPKKVMKEINHLG
jgi:hypothetical protein